MYNSCIVNMLLEFRDSVYGYIAIRQIIYMMYDCINQLCHYYTTAISISPCFWSNGSKTERAVNEGSKLAGALLLLHPMSFVCIMHNYVIRVHTNLSILQHDIKPGEVVSHQPLT